MDKGSFGDLLPLVVELVAEAFDLLLVMLVGNLHVEFCQRSRISFNVSKQDCGCTKQFASCCFQASENCQEVFSHCASHLARCHAIRDAWTSTLPTLHVPENQVHKRQGRAAQSFEDAAREQTQSSLTGIPTRTTKVRRAIRTAEHWLQSSSPAVTTSLRDRQEVMLHEPGNGPVCSLWSCRQTLLQTSLDLRWRRLPSGTSLRVLVLGVCGWFLGNFW